MGAPRSLPAPAASCFSESLPSGHRDLLLGAPTVWGAARSPGFGAEVDACAGDCPWRGAEVLLPAAGIRVVSFPAPAAWFGSTFGSTRPGSESREFLPKPNGSFTYTRLCGIGAPRGDVRACGHVLSPVLYIRAGCGGRASVASDVIGGWWSSADLVATARKLGPCMRSSPAPSLRACGTRPALFAG